jgi:23S rRNA pseudouridine1911/1915/1917 synthase
MLPTPPTLPKALPKLPVFHGGVCLEPDKQTRLDCYIADTLCLMRRSQIKRRLLCAKVNDKAVKVSRLIKNGDVLNLSWEDPAPLDLIAEDMPLDIVYEDEKVIVINKAQGLVVHPGAGNRSGTLVNALLAHQLKKNKSGVDLFGGERPFIVHRLDKDTSGLIIAAWDNDTVSFLSDQFKERAVRKTYAAIVKGAPKEQRGIITTHIIRDPKDRKRFVATPEGEKGKLAVTRYRVIRNFGAHSLVLLRPKTGRTHQLRVHLKYLGAPILGDPIYSGADKRFPRATLMLHAKKLAITLPGATERSVFTSPLPSRFLDFIRLWD